MVSKKKSSSKKKATKEAGQKNQAELIPRVPNPTPQPVETEEYNPREKYMTLGDHLEDLRWVFIKIIGTMLALMTVSLFFGREIHTFFVKP